MKFLIVLFAAAVPVLAQSSFVCLVSEGGKRPIRLQFTFPTSGSDTGFVAYAKGRGSIPVLRTKEMAESGAHVPSTIRSTFLELPDGGTYVVQTKGAVLSGFVYHRKDGKHFRFRDDPDAWQDEGCRWK